MKRHYMGYQFNNWNSVNKVQTTGLIIKSAWPYEQQIRKQNKSNMSTE
jgi:hypothetical protein